jgi:hypothetical protein
MSGRLEEDDMKYSEWLEKVWHAIDERWDELSDSERASGIPCDTEFLKEVGIDVATMSVEQARAAGDAAYQALKAIEDLGLLLESRARRFRLVDSAPRQLGRPLSPLLEPYRHEPLEPREEEFLGKLAEIARSTSASDPYVLLQERPATEVFRALGWPWMGTLDREAVGITQTLRMAGMLETRFAGKLMTCLPTAKGMARIEG